MTRWVHRNLPRALLRLRLRHVLRRPRGPLLWTTGTTANAVFYITPSGAFLLRPAVYFYSGVDRRLQSKIADDTAGAIIAELGGLPKQALQTITHDNGGEFARHVTVKDRIGLTAYFCDPHSPWQRGGIENTNGRLRRDLPRKTSLSHYSDADIDEIVWMLNSTPRKCLGFQTPIEALAQQLGVALEM